VTQSDLDAVQGDGSGGLLSAFVTNNATANTTFGSTDVVSPADSVTVQGAALPGLSVAKDVTSGAEPAAVDDVLVYTITTTNSGNQRVSGITVNYTVTQSDIDVQALTNTARAEGSSPDGTVVGDTGSDAHPLEPDAGAVTVLKELSSGLASAAYTDVGEEIVFTITVTNSGNVTLDTIDVTDSRVAGTCRVGPLAPGASDNSCLFSYQITQDDIDAGEL